MADQDKTKKEKTEQEKTIGKQQADVQPATNGATADASAPAGSAKQEEVKTKQEEIVETFTKAKQELQDAVGKLRSEMSKLDVKEAQQRARTWVEENPTLAVALAVGAGILVGRLLSAALTPSPPPPLPQRLKKRGRAMASRARHYVHDVGDVVAERTSEAVEALTRKAHEAGEELVRRAQELGENVARRAGEAAAVASERAADWSDTVVEHAGRASHAFRDSARELPETVRERADHGLGFAESLLNAAKAVTAAVIVKRVTDWFRRA